MFQEKLQGQFVEKTSNIAYEFSGKWIRNEFLNKKTERVSAQEHAIRTNSIKAKIDKRPVFSKCRLCGTKEETVMHLVSGCSKLAQKQYKRRDNNVARRVNWELCKKQGLESSGRRYGHTPADVMETGDVEFHWDLTIQTDIIVEQ